MDTSLSSSVLNIEGQKDISFDVWQGSVKEWVKPGNTFIYDAAFIRFDSFSYLDSNIFLLGLVRLKESGILCLSLPVSSLNSRFKLVDSIIKKTSTLSFKLDSISESIDGEIEVTLSRKDLDLTGNSEFFLASGFVGESLDIFFKVFKHKISTEFWHWKYGYGSGLSLIAFVDARPCGHYGGMNRPVMINGCQYSGLQACDVALLEKNRGGFLKSFFKYLALFFIRNAYASGVDFIYGFPHIRVMKLGERLGLSQYGEKIRNLTVKSVGNDFRGVHFERVSFEEFSLYVNDCLLRLNDSLSSFGFQYLFRDKAYLVHRYNDHPEYKYEYYLSNDKSSLFIIKRNNKEIFIMDYIGDFDSLEFNLKSFFLSVADCVVTLWMTDNVIEQFICSDSFSISNYIACFSYSSASLEFYNDKFFISMGDTDFI